MSRYRSKKDANQNEIVTGLEEAGCTVIDMSAINKSGVPDLCVGFGSKNYLIEIVGPDKLKRFPPDGLSDNQIEWHKHWNGSVYKAASTQEALDVMGIGHRGQE